ncbi:hypothetical protein V8F20_012812 [Naviculisporaceae sp. PSN 640]
MMTVRGRQASIRQRRSNGHAQKELWLDVSRVLRATGPSEIISQRRLEDLFASVCEYKFTGLVNQSPNAAFGDLEFRFAQSNGQPEAIYRAMLNGIRKDTESQVTIRFAENPVMSRFMGDYFISGSPLKLKGPIVLQQLKERMEGAGLLFRSSSKTAS